MKDFEKKSIHNGEVQYEKNDKDIRSSVRFHHISVRLFHADDLV